MKRKRLLPLSPGNMAAEPNTDDVRVHQIRSQANQVTLARGTSRPVQQCEFLIPDDNRRNGSNTFMIAMREAGKISDKKKICSYFMSMLSCLLPGLKSTFLDVLKNNGIAIREVHIPSEAAANFIEVDIGADWPSILVYFGCCILIIFKNITNASYYASFMSRRIRAMRSIVGVLDSTADVHIPFRLEQAIAIKSMIGSNHTMRRTLLEFILSKQTSDRVGSLCMYLSKILEWSEMAAFIFMHETLCITRSAVLLDPRVGDEVKNLANACRAIHSCSHPQFFRFLADRREQSKLERTRFHVLIAVAKELKKEVCSSAAGLVTAYVDTNLVNELIMIHKRGTAEQTTDNVADDVMEAYLYLVSAADEVDEAIKFLFNLADVMD